MADFVRPGGRSAHEPDATVHRLGHHVIGLLEAARAFGDPGLIAQAEAAAHSVGHILGRGLPPLIDEETD